MKEHDVVRTKEPGKFWVPRPEQDVRLGWEVLPQGEEGTIVHEYKNYPNVVEVEFNRLRRTLPCDRGTLEVVWENPS